MGCRHVRRCGSSSSAPLLRTCLASGTFPAPFQTRPGRCAAALHRLGYVHRDIKLENCLLASTAASATSSSAPPSSVKLIDMGSAAFVDGCTLTVPRTPPRPLPEPSETLPPGCTLLDRARSRCTSLDPDRSPCSPLYAPPEQFASPDFPFAFDVYCLGISYLRLSLSCLKSDSQLEAFRIELSSLAGGASPAAAAPEPVPQPPP